MKVYILKKIYKTCLVAKSFLGEKFWSLCAPDFFRDVGYFNSDCRVFGEKLLSFLDSDFPNGYMPPCPVPGGQGLPHPLLCLGLEVEGLPLVVMKIHVYMCNLDVP